MIKTMTLRVFNKSFSTVIPCLTRNPYRFQLKAGMTKVIELLNSLTLTFLTTDRRFVIIWTINPPH